MRAAGLGNSLRTWVQKWPAWVSGHRGQSGRADVPTLGQTLRNTEHTSCKHRFDSQVFNLFVFVSAIRAPSVPLRSPELFCLVPS